MDDRMKDVLIAANASSLSDVFNENEIDSKIFTCLDQADFDEMKLTCNESAKMFIAQRGVADANTLNLKNLELQEPNEDKVENHVPSTFPRKISFVQYNGIRFEDGTAVRYNDDKFITMQASQCISPENHTWGVKIIDCGTESQSQSECLLIGLLPDSVVNEGKGNNISDLGGWALSNLGKVHGNWKFENTNMTFGSGSVVRFDIDLKTGKLRINVDGHTSFGEIPLVIGEKVFPAFSLLHGGQKISFV